jgi:hypothetical protein
MTEQQPTGRTEKPRAEPEIILPGAPVDFRSSVWRSTDIQARERIYIAKLGPIGSAVLFFLSAFSRCSRSFSSSARP